MRRQLHAIPVFLILFFLFAVAMLPRAATAQSGVDVCIDPGHGSHTGAFNEMYTLWEDDINLDVALQLADLLHSDGYSYALTRTSEDVNPSNADRYNFCNGRSAKILVSVHTNSATNPNIDGTMTLYMKKEDVALAQTLHTSLLGALGTGSEVTWTFTDFGLERFASGVLLKSKMPSAIIEPVLMSYNPEAELLQANHPSGRRSQIALATLSGIKAYLANANGGGSDGGGSGGGGGKCPPKKPGC